MCRLRAAALAALLLGFGATACAKNDNSRGGSLLNLNTPGLVASGAAAGYVDIDKVVAAHPLHSRLQALQDQITQLNASAVSGPTPVTPAQIKAQDSLQHDLSDAQTAFTQSLADKQAAYHAKEQQADADITSKALGTSAAGPGGIVGGLQADFQRQLAAMQLSARQTLDAYRSDLFKQDGDHLKHVQALLGQDVVAKIRAKDSQLSAGETAYQITLARQDQDQRLNLKAKLDNLSLSAADRQTYSSQLQAIESREASLIAQMKATDQAISQNYRKQIQDDASKRFNAERAATEKDTNAKLAARQTELESAIRTQAVQLGGQFQSKLNTENATLSGNQKVQSQLADVHAKILAQYQADATAAMATYQATRKQLVAKYSAVARMQFQDNVALSMQAEQLAQQRKQLYDGIVRQVQGLVADVARRDGVGIVFSTIAGAGTAVDLTEQVAKEAAALPSTSSPPSVPGG
ncbi:MAG TPA: OmpH family outer membrane protein [Candidatus Eremiobacteraceae bacterium]|nr:OmpH family outer membrane protein [Candidatus Eremiobacteraceae bacterium]